MWYSSSCQWVKYMPISQTLISHCPNSKSGNWAIWTPALCHSHNDPSSMCQGARWKNTLWMHNNKAIHTEEYPPLEFPWRCRCMIEGSCQSSAQMWSIQFQWNLSMRPYSQKRKHICPDIREFRYSNFATVIWESGLHMYTCWLLITSPSFINIAHDLSVPILIVWVYLSTLLSQFYGL